MKERFEMSDVGKAFKSVDGDDFILVSYNEYASDNSCEKFIFFCKSKGKIISTNATGKYYSLQFIKLAEQLDYAKDGLLLQKSKLCNNENIFKIEVTFKDEKQALKEWVRNRGFELMRLYACSCNASKDWRKSKDKEYYKIQYSFISEELRVDFVSDSYSDYYSDSGVVYFEKYKDADACIRKLKEKFSEEDLRIIFSVAQ